MTCSNCKAGYFLYSDNCLPCVDQCNQCKNATTCQHCVDGLYFDNLGQKCVECPDNCANCLDTKTCKKCSKGYYLINKLCLVCISNCIECDSPVCKKCKTGYFWLESKCTDCGINCLKCDHANGCTSCKNGYILTNKICTACNELNSNTCSTCITASFGHIYDYKNFICNRCTDNCLKCTTDAGKNN
ncbi:hypothetical protein A3Q56_01956, partial [Intoshia linei]